MNNISMLNARCSTFSCRNMYVRNDHGCSQACMGLNPSATRKLGEVNNVL